MAEPLFVGAENYLLDGAASSSSSAKVAESSALFSRAIL